MMSMPEFPDSKTILSTEQAINSILTSIAMEEAALSHIINAEGEKLQYVLDHKYSNIQEIIEANESVSSLLDRIIDLQLILKIKFQKAAAYLPVQPEKDDPPKKLYKPCV